MSVSNYQAMIELVQKLAGKKDWSTQIYITITEDALAGLFLDRVVWWSDKSSREDGYFWKKAEEWETELYISYAQIKRLVGILETKGLIETKIQRANGAPTLHYRPVLSSIINAIKSKFKKVEIQESRNSEKPEMEIEESLKSEIEESSNSITAKTSNDSSKLLPNGNGGEPPTASQPAFSEEFTLEPDTPETLLLFEKINENRKVERRRPAKRFKSIEQKKKCLSAAKRLGYDNFSEGLNSALANGTPPVLKDLVNYIAKYGTKNGAVHAAYQQSSKSNLSSGRSSQPGGSETPDRAEPPSGAPTMAERIAKAFEPKPGRGGPSP